MKNMKRNITEACVWMMIFVICVVAGECTRRVLGLEVLGTYWAFGPIRIDMDVRFVMMYTRILWSFIFTSCKAGNAIWYRKNKD